MAKCRSRLSVLPLPVKLLEKATSGRGTSILSL
jgi:hypothetical protein